MHFFPCCLQAKARDRARPFFFECRSLLPERVTAARSRQARHQSPLLRAYRLITRPATLENPKPAPTFLLQRRMGRHDVSSASPSPPASSRQKQKRWRRPRGPLGCLGLAAALCLSTLSRIAAHDPQDAVPAAVVVEPVPQQALEQVLWEEHQEPEEENPFAWLNKRLRGNGTFSEMLRDRLYDDEIERLNPTCAVIGLLLRTVPICPFVRRLEKCKLANRAGWEGGRGSKTRTKESSLRRRSSVIESLMPWHLSPLPPSPPAPPQISSVPLPPSTSSSPTPSNPPRK